MVRDLCVFQVVFTEIVDGNTVSMMPTLLRLLVQLSATLGLCGAPKSSQTD